MSAPEISVEDRTRRMIDDLKWFHEQGVRVLIFARKGTLTVKFSVAPTGRRTKAAKGGK